MERGEEHAIEMCSSSTEAAIIIDMKSLMPLEISIVSIEFDGKNISFFRVVVQAIINKNYDINSNRIRRVYMCSLTHGKMWGRNVQSSESK